MVMIVATAYIFYENLWMVLLLWPYLYFYMKEQTEIVRQREKQQYLEEFKEGMLAVAFALNVGYSVENSIGEAVEELTMLYGKESYTVGEFQHMVQRMKHNENLEDLLDAYGRRSGIEEIVYFAEVFRFAKRSGGDFILIIKNTAETIRQKAEVLRQIQTIVSGKRMEQRVMSMIPYGMIGYLKWTAPEFIEPLYGNMLGMGVMTICLILLVIANQCAKRIVDIEV